jgi:choline dehydrogenase
MTFDYVIVGAGSAGCVLANRLSEDPSTRVLLIEAGPDDDDSSVRIPAAFSNLFRTERDWGFHTVPQDDLDGRELYQPRGRTLGGSSSINAMIYIRGHRLDYDGWAAEGCEGWDYDSVLPYFCKSEGQRRFKRHPAHGSTGPLAVSDLRSPNPLSRRFVRAATQLGYEATRDFNSGEQDSGFGLYQVTQDKGRRCSAADAFLHPVEGRPNLHVWTETYARRIDIEDGRATGLEIERGGHLERVRADREVILAAGAFGSPHLLMLSGVGPGGHLRDHGVEVVRDLGGVGETLQDHLMCAVTRRTKFRDTLDVAEVFPRLASNLFNYFVRDRGVFTSNVGEAGGFVRSEEGLEAPDLQYHFAPGFFLEHGFRNPEAKRGYTAGAVVLTPESRGRVRLTSANPKIPASIDPRYFSDPDGEDLRRAIEGFRIAQDLVDAPAFEDVNDGPYEPERVLEGDDEIADFLRERSETLYHPVGTCKMGQGEDAVVDETLRVHGLDGLRVVDASVMPTITRGNTNAPTLMIAEKAAAMILAESQPVGAGRRVREQVAE